MSSNEWTEDDDTYAGFKRLERLRETTDRVTLVVLGHFQIERVLDNLLTAVLHKPGRFVNKDVGFATKEMLLWSLGVLPDGVHSLLVALNKLRNKIAHPSYENMAEADVQEGHLKDIITAVKTLQIGDLKYGNLVLQHAFPDNLKYIYESLPHALFLLTPAERYDYKPIQIDIIHRAIIHGSLGDETWVEQNRDKLPPSLTFTKRDGSGT